MPVKPTSTFPLLLVVSLSHIILSRLGAHILTGTLLDRHARQHLGEQSCTNPLSFSFSPDCSLVASTASFSLLLDCIPPLATHSTGSVRARAPGWLAAAEVSLWKRARRDRTSKKHDSRNMHTNNNFKKQITSSEKAAASAVNAYICAHAHALE